MRRVHRGRRRGSWGRPGGGASSSAPPASPQAEPPGVMGRLLLVLWALLGSRACAGGAAEPGKGRRGLRGRAAGAPGWRGRGSTAAGAPRRQEPELLPVLQSEEPGVLQARRLRLRRRGLRLQHGDLRPE